MAGIAFNLKAIKRAFLDALFPIFCLGCRKEGDWLCAECRSAITVAPLSLCPGCGHSSPGGVRHLRCANASGLDALVSPYHYANPALRRLIKEYKYRGSEEIGSIIAGLTASAANSLSTLFPKRAVIVPLPLHPSRERQRGFNQAATIGKALADALGLPMSPLLSRVRRTEEQARLSIAERMENCRRAFCAPREILGDVILVDDVVTSGATISAAAEEIKKAGAHNVIGFALAHGRGDRFL